MTDGLSRAIPFAMMPILAIYLRPNEFGIASNFLIFVNLISALIGLNTYSYYSVEYFRVNDSKKSKLAFNLIFTNTLSFVLCLTLPIFFGSKFEELYFIPIYWQFLGVLMALFMLVFELFTTYLRLEEKSKLFIRYKTIATSLSAILSLLFVIVFELSWEGRVLALLLASLILSVLSIYIFRKNGMFKLEFDFKEIKSVVEYGFPLIPHKLSSWVSNGVASALITKKHGIYDTGLFAFAQNMTSVVQMFSVSFATAFSPHVYKQLSIVHKEEERTYETKISLIKKTYFALLAFGVGLLGLYFVLTFVIRLIYNNNYEASIVFIPYLFIASFFGFAYNLVSVYVFYSKKVKYFGILSLSIGLLSAFINTFAITEYGVIGAAYTAVLISIVKLIVTGLYGQKVFPMPWIAALSVFRR